MLTLNRSTKSYEAILNEQKAQANREIERLTDKVRSVHITPIISQSTIYEKKMLQATKFLAEEIEPTSPEGFEFIFAEVGITAETPGGVATKILEKSTSFDTQTGPAIERVRLTASRDVSEATTKEEIESVMLTFRHDILQLG